MNGRSINLEEENGATKLDFWVRDGMLMKMRACILRRISGDPLSQSTLHIVHPWL